MTKFTRVLVLLLVSALLSFTPSAYAEEAEKKKEEVKKEAPKAEEKKADSKPEEKEDAEEKKAEPCKCHKPAIESLSKAYNSLEEDEWKDAIKVCKEVSASVKKLSETCKCEEVKNYVAIVGAYSQYAQGGQILDGEDDIDCPKAKKLYDNAMKALQAALPKIKDDSLKEEVENIRDYCEEEKAFVDDECE